MQDYTGAGTIFGATGGVMEAGTAAALTSSQPKQTPTPMLSRKFAQQKKPVCSLGAKQRLTSKIIRFASPLPLVLEMPKNSLMPLKRVKFTMTSLRLWPALVVALAEAGSPSQWTVRWRIAQKKYCVVLIALARLRRSHDNPDITKIYENFLGTPLSHKAHDLLHTH